MIALKYARNAAALGLLVSVGVPTSVVAAEVPKIATGADWRSNVEAFAKENFKHPAWGHAHSTRIFWLAKSLAKKDEVAVDDDVLFAAAMMHDIAAFPHWAVADKDHADRAADLLPDMLKEAGFPEAKIPAVLDAVRTHMFDRAPASAEAIYIHDADALDWLGAVGAYRLIAIVEVGGGQPNAEAAIGLLRQRLALVPAGIVSRAGKKEGKIRAQSLKAFLDELSGMSANFTQL